MIIVANNLSAKDWAFFLNFGETIEHASFFPFFFKF